MPLGIRSRLSKAASIIAKATSEPHHYEFDELSPSHFEIRNGNRVTLFQDAHCEGDFLSPIVKHDGSLDLSYLPQNCFEQIYVAILNAKRFVYITGWSIDTKISLLRRKPIFVEEGSNETPPSGKMTIGELLIYKACQGVRVLLHVWDEALSLDISGYETTGIMCTYDEETKKYFGGTGVECKLSYRTGSTKDNQFLWTHHQKSIIVDALPVSESLYGSLSLIKTCPYMTSNECTENVQKIINNMVLSEKDYAKRDKDGNRYVISSFMTVEHKYLKMWEDDGSKSRGYVSIYRPLPPPGWFSLGDIAQRNLDAKPNVLTKIMVVHEPPPIPGEPPMLSCPVGFGQVWPIDSTYTSNYGSVVFWEPIAPDGYEALGFVVTSTMEPPSTNIIRCVHRDALEEAHVATEKDQYPIWRNKGKNRELLGGPAMSLWKLIPNGSGLVSGTFVVRGGYYLPPLHLQDQYWCLKRPPLGNDVCPKPSSDYNGIENPYYSSRPPMDSFSTDVQEKRRIIAFVGGLDLTYGRWDTPGHPIFRSLDLEHKNDFLHGWGISHCFGPREPWHDIHSKLEGPIARDILINFEQRWRKQGKDHTVLYDLGNEFISVQEEEIHDDESWCCRLCRSIDPFSADISYIDNSIQRSYIEAIRKAERFIYIENQYFMGSSRHWFSHNHSGCVNLIPFEIANRIAQSIAVDFFPIVAYILIPLYPEVCNVVEGGVGVSDNLRQGYPMDAAIQEQLFWQWNSMVMMYDIINKALTKKGKIGSPMDYLKFLCVGQREEVSLSTAQKSDAPPDSKERILFLSRRVPIYVHSKMMIIDDKYIILGSANINERSMAGDRDSEICVESWQPKYINFLRPSGSIHKFRMSLWAEHVGESLSEFLQPNSPECVKKITEICEKNWELFTNPIVSNMHSHLMRYPIRWISGALCTEPEFFPDTQAPVKGQPSTALPELLTC